MLRSDADVTGSRLLEPDIPSLTVNTPVNVKKRSESNVNFIVPMSAVRSIETVYSIGQQNIAYQSCPIGDHLIATGRGCSLPSPHRDTDVRSVPGFPWSCCFFFFKFPLIFDLHTKTVWCEAWKFVGITLGGGRKDAVSKKGKSKKWKLIQHR